MFSIKFNGHQALATLSSCGNLIKCWNQDKFEASRKLDVIGFPKELVS